MYFYCFVKKGVCTFQALEKKIPFVMSGEIISCSFYSDIALAYFID